MTTESVGILEFNLRRSAAYHSKRQGFFSLMHGSFSVLGTLSSVLAGGILVVNYQFNPSFSGQILLITALLALLPGVLSVLDNQFRLAESAAAHGVLKEKYLDLVAQLVIALRSNDETSIEFVSKEYHGMNAKERPRHKIVNIQAHNDTVTSYPGLVSNPNVYNLGAKSLVAHIWRFSGWTVGRRDIDIDRSRFLQEHSGET